MRELLRTTAIAFAFLTRLPVPSVGPAGDDLVRASALFPLVGLVVATVAIVVRVLVEPLWGPVAGSVAGVFAAVAVTGAMHEDGLADTADGMWGAWDAEGRIAVMRDSRLGTYGTIALIAVFALRLALLAPTGTGAFAAAMVSGHVLGRAAPLLLVRLVPAVGGGSSVAIAGPVPRAFLVAAVVLAVVPPLAVAGVAALPALAVAALVTLGLARVFRARLGGVTGDTLGAATVTVEVCVAAAVLAWP